MPIALTNENYYSTQANIDYMSVSQFKDFAGTTCHFNCEETAFLKYKGLIPQATSEALLMGSYIDAYYEGTLDEFKQNNPELFKKTGDRGLLAKYVQVDDIIRRLNKDPMFTSYMSGDKQVIMTAKLFGVDWKIKMDSYLPGDKIVDLKLVKDMNPIWNPATHSKVDFIHYWGYDIQGAVYQKIVELVTGYRLPFYIAAATKEKITKYDIIQITQPHLDAALEFVENYIQHVLDIKTGKIAPVRCETCAHCLATKRIKAPITIDDIMPNQTDAHHDIDFEEDDDE